MKREEIIQIQHHRPYPLPKGDWVMQQTWKDLLFLHYRVPVDRLRLLIPAELEIDTFEGDAWLGITPFKMRNLKLRSIPSLPTATDFLELNMRTYVKLNGKSGIWFFSLDCSSLLAVVGARLGACLPYYFSDMTVENRGGIFHYFSRRNGGHDEPVCFELIYRPASGPFESINGSLEEWLTERYCLFQETKKGRMLEIDIHHLKWPLQLAQAEVVMNMLGEPFGFELEGQQPLAHFSKRQKVLFWPPQPA
ncbi:MAG: YqjF family protein [Mangrovibacterium sp.]